MGQACEELATEIGTREAAPANNELAAPPALGSDVAPSPADESQLEELAGHLLRLRRERERLFGDGLFADPAWDMLLDLYAQRGCDRPVSISSLAMAAAVPPTTALRHMDLLEVRGLIVRSKAPKDGRVRYVQLTETACDRLRSLLQKFELSGWCCQSNVAEPTAGW